MKTERLKWLAEEKPGECSLDEVRKMASELLKCRPYRAMADDVLAAYGKLSPRPSHEVLEAAK